jgi:hypothetical protein
MSLDPDPAGYSCGSCAGCRPDSSCSAWATALRASSWRLSLSPTTGGRPGSTSRGGGGGDGSDRRAANVHLHRQKIGCHDIRRWPGEHAGALDWPGRRVCGDVPSRTGADHCSVLDPQQDQAAPPECTRACRPPGRPGPRNEGMSFIAEVCDWEHGDVPHNPVTATAGTTRCATPPPKGHAHEGQPRQS